MSEEINEITEEAETIAAEEVEAEGADGEKVGNIKISIDVVSTIAGVATMNCEGVYGMAGTLAGDIAERLGAKKNPNKGVKIDMTETNVSADLYIVVKYGVRIPELAWEVQESVKNNIESMTGLTVDKVNIHIEGVNFDDELPDEAAEEYDEAPAEENVEENVEASEETVEE